MEKIKVRVTKGFPFYHAEDRLYITSIPVEVTSNDWLKAQVDAGLVEIVATEPKPKQAKPKQIEGTK